MKIDNMNPCVNTNKNVEGQQSTKIPPKALKDIMERTCSAAGNPYSDEAYSYKF